MSKDKGIASAIEKNKAVNCEICSKSFGTCKATWAMMWLSSCYEIAQVTLQGSAKGCIKVRILIFSQMIQHFFFVIKTIFHFFSYKKNYILKNMFFFSKKGIIEYRNNGPGCFTSTVWT